MTPCPKCHGRGESQLGVLACRRDGTSELKYRKAICLGCDGTGQITESRLADMNQGQADREMRVHGAYKTQHERATELGITPQELSRWENYGIRWAPR
jgi:RecJ-like exonuclease